jgi:hypothetical protein
VIAAPRRGFVFLAMRKCASTAIENAIRPYGQIQMGGPPEFKHITYGRFHAHLAPLLKDLGYARDSYEVICMVREPVDWLGSWWRYRSREDLSDPKRKRHVDYTGDMTFDEFVDTFIAGEIRRVRSQAEFARAPDGSIGVDRVYRYENLGELISWLEARVGSELSLEHINVSPKRAVNLAPARRAALEEHLAEDFTLYDRAL